MSRSFAPREVFGLLADRRLRPLTPARRSAQACPGGLARPREHTWTLRRRINVAFAAMASSPGTDIKVIGTALSVGVLTDATLVRALLVPAMVSLLGTWTRGCLPACRPGEGAARRTIPADRRAAAATGGRARPRL